MSFGLLGLLLFFLCVYDSLPLEFLRRLFQLVHSCLSIGMPGCRMHFLLESGVFAVLVLLFLMQEQRHFKLNGLVDIDQREPRSSKLWRFQGMFINIGMSTGCSSRLEPAVQTKKPDDMI